MNIFAREAKLFSESNHSNVRPAFADYFWSFLGSQQKPFSLLLYVVHEGLDTATH